MHLVTVKSETRSIFCKNPISDACTCDHTLSVIIQDSWSYVRMRTKLFCKLRALPFSTILVSRQPSSVKLALLHYSLGKSDIHFFVLPSVTRGCNPKMLELLYLLQCCSIRLQHALIRVSWKMEYLSFGRAYFYSGCVTCICKPI